MSGSQPRRALVVAAHPCADSYSAALRDATARGLERCGHHVDVIDLYADGFRASMDSGDLIAYKDRLDAPDPQVRTYGELVKQADLLVFVYPTWWSGLPAILKGWLERVLVPGVGFTFNARGKVRPALGHVRRIVGVSTYGSPWSFNKLTNDNGRRTLTRALRLSCGWRTRTTWLGLYSIDTSGDSDRAAFLDRVEHTMAHL